MKRALGYLIAMLTCYAGVALFLVMHKLKCGPEGLQLAILCGLSGGIGGVTYCLRGIYLNACVFDQWNDKWLPWYFIRPLVSFVCGIVSCLFLKAGLIVLEAKQLGEPTNLAFFALAFIAGLNVDKFVEKIEDIAQVTWGIKKSRTARKEDDHA
jgi:hypothetical protein